MLNNQKPVKSNLIAACCVICIAILIIIFNGGIGIGFENHTGLIPVVRRILNPDYLPGDFGISTRFYHHRIFAYIVAGLSRFWGEDNALILLNFVGMTCLSATLFYLCKTLKLSLAGFFAVGCFLAMSVVRTGSGLESNNFVGGPNIMPPTFADALVLLGVATLLEGRYRITAFIAGMVLLFHVQIGLIFVLLLFPFYALKIKAFGLKGVIWLAFLFLTPASLALSHLFHMVHRGLMTPSFSLYYIQFRQPHHFELSSVKALVLVMMHLGVQSVVYWWLCRARRPESRKMGVLLAISLLLTAFSLLHFLDYYLLKNGTIIKIQFLRMSPLITVFGAISLVTAANVWENERLKHRGIRRISLANTCLILVAILYSFCRVMMLRADYFIGIRKSVDQPSSWVDMCLWIAEHAPRDTVYLTPPGNEGFTYLSNRSTVVDFKINPDGGQYLPEWFQRLRDLAGGTLPNKRGLENGTLLNQAFASLQTYELVRLGEKYNARYAVLPKSSSADFKVVYKNNEYRLVKLPTQQSTFSFIYLSK